MNMLNGQVQMKTMLYEKKKRKKEMRDNRRTMRIMKWDWEDRKQIRNAVTETYTSQNATYQET